MEFKKENFLNNDQLEQLITSVFTNERAKIISSKLKDFILIDGEILYILQKNITYKEDNIKVNIITMISELIEDSFKALQKHESDLLVMKYPKQYSNIFKNSVIETYYPQILKNIQHYNNFDKTLCQLHYNNGYLDLSDMKFKPRIIGQHYIINYIQRDYKPSTIEQQEKIMKIIKMIYTNKQDMDAMLLLLGSCLSGKTTADQDLMFLCGKGSSGKSFLMELTSLSIECYLKELKDDTFSQSNSKIDKILNSFVSNPQIRITWINEPKDSRFDDSLFKTFCDGKLQTTQLYKDGSLTTQHYSKLFFTLNNMPNIKLDSGIIRRIKSCTHKSKFTDKKQEVNEQKHIYLKDINLLTSLVENNLLDAWVDILSTKCNSWLNGEKIQYNENFEETKNTIISSNDIFQDFIDSKLVKTSSDADRIGKDDMYKMFKCMYPEKRLTVAQVVTSLKDKGMDYSLKLRANKIQGCFYFVRPYHELDDELESDSINNESPLDANITKPKVEEVKDNTEILEQNDKLITKINTLQDNEMKNLMKIQELEMMILELKKQATQKLSHPEISSITDILNF